MPEVVYRGLGHPLVLGAMYLVFLSGLLAHGLVIWQNPVVRLAAVVAGLLVVSVTVVTVRHGAFRRRGVVELCQAPDQAGVTLPSSPPASLFPQACALNLPKESNTWSRLWWDATLLRAVLRNVSTLPCRGARA